MRSALFLILLGFSGFPAVAQHSKITLLKAGKLLDARAGKYLINQGVLIEDGKVKQVGSFEQLQAHLPKGAAVIDLSRATVLPGLIDCHAHLLAAAVGTEENSLLQEVAGMSPSRLVGCSHGP